MKLAANIKNLIRLHEWNVDEKRRKLAELQHLEDELRGQISNLEEQLVIEQKAAAENPAEGGLAYANFANQVIQRRENLQDSLAQMSHVILGAREELAESYRDLKKYETVQRNRKQRERQEQNRLEQAVLDEVGLSMHRIRIRDAANKRTTKKRA